MYASDMNTVILTSTRKYASNIKRLKLNKVHSEFYYILGFLCEIKFKSNCQSDKHFHMLFLPCSSLFPAWQSPEEPPERQFWRFTGWRQPSSPVLSEHSHQSIFLTSSYDAPWCLDSTKLYTGHASAMSHILTDRPGSSLLPRFILL